MPAVASAAVAPTAVASTAMETTAVASTAVSSTAMEATAVASTTVSSATAHGPHAPGVAREGPRLRLGASCSAQTGQSQAQCHSDCRCGGCKFLVHVLPHL